MAGDVCGGGTDLELECECWCAVRCGGQGASTAGTGLARQQPCCARVWRVADWRPGRWSNMRSMWSSMHSGKGMGMAAAVTVRRVARLLLYGCDGRAARAVREWGIPTYQSSDMALCHCVTPIQWYNAKSLDCHKLWVLACVSELASLRCAGQACDGSGVTNAVSHASVFAWPGDDVRDPVMNQLNRTGV